MNIVTDNLDQIIDAPDGIKRLRELILQLAVQGKLVEQRPEEGTAADLLKQIEEAKRKDVEERKARGESVRKTKSLPPLEEDEIPFDVPKYWGWIRFDSLFRFIDYRGKTPKKTTSGIRLITAKNIRMGFLNLEPQEFVSEKTYNEWMTRGFPQVGDLLFTTEAPMGNVCTIGIDPPFALAQRSICLHPFGSVIPEFLMYEIMSQSVQDLIVGKSSGMTATGIKAARLKALPLPLPPLAEQKRIVAKVDELMAWCDELDALKEKRDALQKVALKSSLRDLCHLEGENALDRITSVFSDLIRDPDDVKQLRDAILQLAVQGRLVEQRKDDGTAADLLKEIEAAKAADERTRKTKPLPPIEEDEIPFNIPKGWKWMRLGEVCTEITDGAHNSPKKTDYGFPYVTVRDVKNDIIDIANASSISPEDYDSLCATGCRPHKWNVLFSKDGTVGKVAVVDFDDEFVVLSSLAILRFNHDLLSPYFLRLILKAPGLLQMAINKKTGSALRRIILARIKELIVPIIPLAEQQRIVEKVDKLMAWCDELETLLQTQSETATRFAAAIAQQGAVHNRTRIFEIGE